MISDHLIAGRWEEVRSPTAKELKATSVLEFTIEEASAKTRSGPPMDDEEDYALPVWAGVVPLHLRAALPLQDPRLAKDIPCLGMYTNFTQTAKRVNRCPRVSYFTGRVSQTKRRVEKIQQSDGDVRCLALCWVADESTKFPRPNRCIAGRPDTLANPSGVGRMRLSLLPFAT